MKVAIVDYNRGNIRSVQKAFESIGINAVITSNGRELLEAEGLVLPGVGAFKDCMDNLYRQGLVDYILDFIATDKPFLGICLGLQLLFSESEEFGKHKGLDVIKGNVVRFSFDANTALDERLKIPHIGWNSINITKQIPIFDSIDNGSYFYFVHSYYVVPKDEDIIAATTCYGVNFVSAIRYKNIFATQFHPEKSQQHGIDILKNFGRLLSC